MAKRTPDIRTIKKGTIIQGGVAPKATKQMNSASQAASLETKLILQKSKTLKAERTRDDVLTKGKSKTSIKRVRDKNRIVKF